MTKALSFLSPGLMVPELEQIVHEAYIKHSADITNFRNAVLEGVKNIPDSKRRNEVRNCLIHYAVEEITNRYRHCVNRFLRDEAIQGHTTPNVEDDEESNGNHATVNLNGTYVPRGRISHVNDAVVQAALAWNQSQYGQISLKYGRTQVMLMNATAKDLCGAATAYMKSAKSTTKHAKFVGKLRDWAIAQGVKGNLTVQEVISVEEIDDGCIACATEVYGSKEAAMTAIDKLL